MPKEINEDLRPSIGAVTRAAKRYVRGPMAEGESFSHYAAENNLATADGLIEAGLYPEGVYPNQRGNLEILMNTAAADVANLYTAMHAFLAEQGDAEADILSIVQRSVKVARQYGSLTNDNGYASEFAAQSFERRAELFEKGTDKDGKAIIKFTEETLLNDFRAYIGRQMGCPVMLYFVACPHTGKQVSVYELYWEAFTADAHAAQTGERTDITSKHI